MAPIAVKPLLARPARAVAEATDHKETDHTLKELWKSTVAVHTVLDQGRSLNALELLLLENHFHLVQMAYIQWKRKQRGLPSE